MAKRKKKKAISRGAESPEATTHPSLPPKDNQGRCKKCKRMLNVCLIEVSRATPTNGIVSQRAYGCLAHAAEIADELTRVLASWTYWPRGADAESQEEPEEVEAPVAEAETVAEPVEEAEDAE